MLRFLTSFALIIFFCNCTNDATANYESTQKVTTNLQKTTSIRIPTSRKVPSSTTSSKAFKIKGKEYIFLVDKRNNALVQIPTSNPTDIIFHNFDREGESGIGGIRGVAPIDNSTILIVSEKPYHYIYDIDEKSITKENLIDKNSGTQLKQADLTSNFYEDFGKLGTTHYFLQTGMTPMTNLGEIQPDYKLLAFYEPTSHTYGYSSFNFPNEYNNTKNFLNFPSLACDGEKCVISLYSDHKIHIINNSEQQYAKMAKSEFVPDEPRQFQYETDNLFEYFATESAYRGMIYDQYRDVFYRIISVVLDEDKAVATKRTNIYSTSPRQAAIMILNKNLEVLGETLLAPDTYEIKNIVVLESGLAISRMHPLNTDQQEDSLLFDVFTF